MNTRVSLQPAYVLHTRPYRDTSALIEVFTAEHGLLTLVARGARRVTPRRGTSGVPQPFAPMLVSYSGRADLKTLTGNEAAGAPVVLRGDRMYSGLYLNELLVRLLHRHDPHPRLFATYVDTLTGLATKGTALDGVLRRFELTLLDELGYRVQFTVEALSQRPVRAQTQYRYDPAVGFIECAAHQQVAGERYNGDELIILARGEFDGAARLAGRRILRQALGVHLGGRPLNSRELFRRTVTSGSLSSTDFSNEPGGAGSS